MKYQYYRQNDDTKGIRRYLVGQQKGQRWDRESKKWSDECADRRACELTHDTELTEPQALTQL